MFQITLNNISKKFGYDWIFKNVSQIFSAGSSHALLGNNGSGKSTLLQIISGLQSSTSGDISWINNNKKINIDYWYQHLSYCAPYQEMVEEFTLWEMCVLQSGYKKWRNNLSIKEIIKKIDLEKFTHKEIKNFSSGMKQRVKLGLAIYADTDVLLLDEPCTNLDKNAIAWYQEEISIWKKNRIVIVASNQPEEYNFCDYQLNIYDYKV